MLYNTLHNRWLRLVFCVVGELISAAAINFFIVPLALYSGGILGVCQLLRTLLQTYTRLDFGAYDVAGILYFLSNVPILLFAYKALGRALVLKTVICTTSYSLFYSILPIPTVPVIGDYLTACLLGGLLTGLGSGIVLTCGGSGGGLDTVGLCLSKRGSTLSVGRFSLAFNAFLYAACLLLFNPEVAIYSVIYNLVTTATLDRMHRQNINVQALIFTHEDERLLADYITEKLGRGVTWWEGTGAYTGEDIHVLCVCLSKYEIDELLHTVHSLDPHAFLTVQEGVHIYGNFQKRLN